ncbi:tetratricopeptide repeat protein [Fluviicola taffensis]|uniref:Protein serine/threonine phosphatase n=1 Tax=Fluviicola taffensis (strain DSM 16823 / NCIMB 13979 / RW262) TaxID=755732 RepID=F2ICU6_FLUTR|nr:tetratricopeptide repeat protein [Fluviicola taffensis]AEA43320.1 protein serine/threonine phosphatase [Fluviicola taffensis DSM 16823]
MILRKGILLLIVILWGFSNSSFAIEIPKYVSEKNITCPRPSSVIEIFNILDLPENKENSAESTEKTPINPEKKSTTTDSISVIKLLNEAKPIVHSDYKKAFKLTNKALEIAEASKDEELIGKVQNSIGNLYWFSGDYNHASEFYINALKNYQKTNNQGQIAECYRNIGWIYLGQGKYELSEEYLLKSLQLNTKLKNQERIIINYDDIGNLYLTSKQYEKGLESCEKSLQLAKKFNLTSAIGTIHITKAQLHYKLDHLSDAEEEYKEGITILNTIPNQSYNLTLGYLGLGKVKKDQNKLNESLPLFEKAIKLSKANNYTPELSEGYLLASKIYSVQNNIGKAYNYMEMYAETKDSVNARNNRNYIQEMGAKLEYEQNKLQIKNLEQEQKLSEASLDRERNFKIFLIVVILFLFVFGLFVYRSFLRKKKDNQLIAKAYLEIEIKNKDISDSIEYALQIQQARLPHIDSIQSCFPGFFVMYLPRDIVSGDFYWFTETETGKKIFAVADCTGHGIPGAFMSMMGIDGLNYAILEKRIESSSHILNHVNKFIIESLKQDLDTVKSKDGMDTAICIFEKDLSSVKYSGANRPLWIIRNNELLSFSPDKMSIGGNNYANYNFNEVDIPLQKGDSLYLFSDGYPDQFGGEKNKKFMTKNLKQLLLDINQLPAQEQETILHQKLNEWKGDFSQIDDIIIVGIKI